MLYIKRQRCNEWLLTYVARVLVGHGSLRAQFARVARKTKGRMERKNGVGHGTIHENKRAKTYTQF